MKQRVTAEQMDELTEPQMMFLQEWLAKRGYIEGWFDPTGQIKEVYVLTPHQPTIGEMIEFLGDIEDIPWQATDFQDTTWAEAVYDREYLCDSLWTVTKQALKRVLRVSPESVNSHS